MSRFNIKTTPTKIENLAGGEAYQVTPEFELVSILLTSFVQDQYYKSGKETVKTLQNLVKTIKDKKFIAKAAIYARTKYGLRSVSHIVAAELFRDRGDGKSMVAGETWPKNFIEKVVYRPDDILEILSYYMKHVQGKTRAMQLRKGIRLALSKFDEYQLAKYRGEGKDVSLIDVVNMMRPTPSEKNKEALSKLINGLLKSTETREAKLSATGQGKTEEQKIVAKKEAWIDLLTNKRLGYMALLKNLRNIIKQAPEMVPEAINQLTDETLVKKSLVLPFRYMSAIQEIEAINDADQSSIRQTLVGLNKAVDISMSNVPTFEGRTLVVVDHSGSMNSVEHGNMSNFQIGALFGFMLTKSNNADFMHFGDRAEYLNFTPTDSTLSILKWLSTLNESGWITTTSRGHNVGHGTNFHSIFTTANKAYDRIIIFSDMQAWIGYNTPKVEFSDYKKKYNVNPHLYTVDLAGNGSAQFPDNQVYALTGFSDKMFEVMKMLEVDKKALMNDIEKIEL